MQILKISIATVLILAKIGLVTSYSSGAPPSTCGSMVPGHPPSTTSGTPPYAINITASGDRDEVVIQGTLYSTNGTLFRGFLIEPVPGNGNAGVMSGNDSSSKNVCGTNDDQGLTHIDNTDKSRVDFTWTYTNDSIGDIQFRAAVVEVCCDESRYWLNITSNTLNPPRPLSTSSSSPPVASSSIAPSGQINFDPECGKSKGCFSDCNSASCTYLVTWQKHDNNNTDTWTEFDETGAILFDLKMKLSDTNNQWVAVGISPDGYMDGTDVAACLSQPSGVTLQSSYNDGYVNVLFNDASLGLSLVIGEVSDGIVHCQFSRIVSLENETRFLDLTQKYYMSVGSGKVLNGVIQQHETDPVTSPDKIDYLKTNVEPRSTARTPPVTNPSTTPPSGSIVYDPACGVSKGCFPDCSNTECTYLVTWYRNITKDGLTASSDTGDVIFDIKMNLGDTTNKWIAIGISPKGKMYGTSVAACLSHSSDITLQSSYNDDVSNILYSDPLLGLKLLGSDVSNGIIHCRFSRAERMANQPTFLDLNETYYLVVSSGPVVSGIIRQHPTDPYKSQNKVNFLENYVSKEDTSGPSTLVKLHATLMVIAWVFLSSIGTVAARHCKSMLAEKVYFKVKAWFFVHRSVMVVAVICIIIAFIVIFVEVGGFSKIAAEAGKEYTKAHPHIGIASTALALLNPILAVFRPSATGSNRPLFNWVHFTVGNVAHLAAVISMFFGIELNTAKVHQSAFYVLIAYCVIYIFVHLCLEIYRRRISAKAYDADHRTNSSSNLISDIGSKQSSFTFYMLIIHGVLMLVLAVFLVVIICSPQKMKDLFDH